MSSPSYIRPNGPTPQQCAAVDLLVAGNSDTAVARHLGLARETVTRWRLHDPAFHEALQSRRDAAWRDSLDALRALIPSAVDALNDQLASSEQRGRLALELLRATGAFAALTSPPPPPSSTTVSEDPPDAAG